MLEKVEQNINQTKFRHKFSSTNANFDFLCTEKMTYSSIVEQNQKNYQRKNCWTLHLLRQSDHISSFYCTTVESA